MTTTTTPADAVVELIWDRAEWADSADEAEAAYHPHGIDADVTRIDSGYFWRVTPTARLTESPELFDAGTAETRAKAKAQAAQGVASALAFYADAKGPAHPDML